MTKWPIIASGLFYAASPVSALAIECRNDCFTVKQERDGAGRQQIIIDNQCGESLKIVAAIVEDGGLRQISETGFSARPGIKRSDCPYSSTTLMCPEVAYGLVSEDEYLELGRKKAESYDKACGLVSAGPPTKYEE